MRPAAKEFKYEVLNEKYKAADPTSGEIRNGRDKVVVDLRFFFMDRFPPVRRRARRRYQELLLWLRRQQKLGRRRGVVCFDRLKRKYTNFDNVKQYKTANYQNTAFSVSELDKFRVKTFCYDQQQQLLLFVLLLFDDLYSAVM